MTLEYLGRHAQRVAIGNARIHKIDLAERTVTLSIFVSRQPGRRPRLGRIEEQEIDALELIDRWSVRTKR